MNKVLFTLSLLAFAAAHADDTLIKKIEADYKKCFDNATSTAGSNECSYIAYEAADKELNRMYREIQTQLNKPVTEDYEKEYNKAAKERLLAAQRAWIATRDASCMEAGLDMFSGTGEGMIIGSCRAIS